MNAVIDLKKINVFIEPQSSGKRLSLSALSLKRISTNLKVIHYLIITLLIKD